MGVPDITGLILLLVIAAGLVCLAGAGILLHGLLHPPRRTYAAALGQGLATHPADMGLEGWEMELRLSDGAKTPAWVIKGRRAEGPMLVVVHGFGDSRYGAMTWAPLFLPYVSSMVVYDLRGHGESETRYATCGTRDVEDLLTVLDQLGEAMPGGERTVHDPHRPVVLFGYSMGAGTAIAAGAKREGGCAAPAKRSIAGVIADGAYRYWDEPIKRFLRMQRYPTQPFVMLTGLLLRVFVRGFGGFDRAGYAAKLECPLLMLHGDHDPLCPLRSAQEIAKASPRSRLVVFEGGGHLDLAAVDPVRYGEALGWFFNEIQLSATL